MRNIQLRWWSFLVLVAFLAAASFGWAQSESKAVVVKAAKHAFAPPLSQLLPIPPPSGEFSSFSDNDDDDERMPPRGPHVTRPARDSVLQESSEASLTSAGDALATLPTNAGLNILGMGYGFSGYSEQAVVPDTNGAVGPTQFVEFVNNSFVVFNKSNGSVEYGPANGNTLWQALGAPCSSNTNLDEIVQFDKLANVWVVLMPVFENPDQLCIAVSTTSDATNGGWNLYDFPVPHNRMPDYPKLAVWPDGYYVTYNQGNNLVFVGAAACALDRSTMLTGAASTMQCFTNISTTYGVLLPGDLYGSTAPPAGSPEYFLNFDANDESLDLWQFHVNWTTPANSTFTGPTNIPVAAFTEACGETAAELNYTTGACIPQKGTSQELDSYGDRLMYPLAYRNLGSYQALLVNHTVAIGTGSAQTGIRWYELENKGSGFGLYQQGTYAPDSNYRWMGSMAMDKLGDIGLGYSVSSGSMRPSIRYTGRVPSDTLGQMESEVDVLSAASVPTASQTNTFRWGDYSGMAIDPTDDCTFWYTTEYHPTSSSPHWGTRIASFSFPSCTQSHTLTVNEVGQGTVTSADGEINCTNGAGTCSAVYASGGSVTLTAKAASGYTFSGWSGSCSGSNPCSLVMNSNLNATATFTSSAHWTLVKETSKGGSPITSLTIPATVTGHLLVVAMAFNGTTSITGVTDNATGGGNAYVSADARSTTGAWSMEIWYAVNAKPGVTVITPKFGTSPTSSQITVWEVAGITHSPPDVKAISSGSVTANNTAGAAVTTTQGGDFIVSTLLANAADFTSITSGNAFTDDFTTSGNGWAHITSSTATAGVHQASWYTASPTGAYCSSTVGFFAAK